MRTKREAILTWYQPEAILYALLSFAGSLFDLEENTEYDIRLQLQDPDGVRSEAEKSITVRTRAEPKPASDGRVFHVYPPGYEGHRGVPSAYTDVQPVSAEQPSAGTGNFAAEKDKK